MQFPNWVRAALQKTVLFSSPSGPRGGAYSIRPYDRVRAILQNTDAISQLDMCDPSKNGSVFVPFRAVCGAYAIRPYGWVRMALQKTVSYPSLSGPRGGRMRYAPTTEYVCPFEIPMRFPDWIRVILRNTDAISRVEEKGRLGGGAVGVTVCGGDGRGGAWRGGRRRSGRR